MGIIVFFSIVSIVDFAVFAVVVIKTIGLARRKVFLAFKESMNDELTKK